jgi:hypothetical protein
MQRLEHVVAAAGHAERVRLEQAVDRNGVPPVPAVEAQSFVRTAVRVSSVWSETSAGMALLSKNDMPRNTPPRPVDDAAGTPHQVPTKGFAAALSVADPAPGCPKYARMSCWILGEAPQFAGPIGNVGLHRDHRNQAGPVRGSRTANRLNRLSPLSARSLSRSAVNAARANAG